MPGREPAFRPGHPLPVDLVIVDESSMLNLRLAEVLLGGLAETTHVVFVGDADQLPPIGAGKPFEDLIAVGRGAGRAADPDLPPGGALDDHHRRPRDQPRAGRPTSSPAPDQDHDFFFIERPSPERALETVVEVVAERAPGSSASTRSARSRCWRRCTKGRSGSTPSTSACRRASTRTASKALAERFRIGDRLIQTRNSHELGLMNGSIVFLRDDDPDEETIVVDTDDGGSLVIPYGETATLKLAYAISVHKAQGCEVPVVVAVCHRSHSRMLTRPLLYTAITRARNSCVLVGDRAALEAAVGRDDGGGRHSGLAERLRA